LLFPNPLWLALGARRVTAIKRELMAMQAAAMIPQALAVVHEGAVRLTMGLGCQSLEISVRGPLL
jgi:hypothetical protein